MAVTPAATVAAAPFVPRQAQQTAAVGGACPTTVPRRLRAARAPPRRARQFVAVQAASDLGFVDSAVGAALLDWVLDNEGHVHPGLRVVEDAPCGGGRGVIATEAISAEDSANVPLLLVPDALYMTSQARQPQQLPCLAKLPGAVLQSYSSGPPFRSSSSIPRCVHLISVLTPPPPLPLPNFQSPSWVAAPLLGFSSITNSPMPRPKQAV